MKTVIRNIEYQETLLPLFSSESIYITV